MIELCCELLSVWCTWLNVLVTSCMHFRVNPLYIFLNVKETLAGNRCKWLCCVLSTYLFRAFACMFLSSHVRISEWIYPLYLAKYSRNKRDIWSLSDWKETQTHSQLIRKPALSHLAKIANWLSYVVSNYLYGAFDWMFCHVTYTFQSESILCIFLNVKELFPQNRCNIWSLIDCHGTQTQNHLVR